MAVKISLGSLLCLVGGIVMIVAGVLAAFDITLSYNPCLTGAGVMGHGGMVSPIFGIVIIICSLLASMKPGKKLLFCLVVGFAIVMNLYLGYDIFLVGNALSIVGVSLIK